MAKKGKLYWLAPTENSLESVVHHCICYYDTKWANSAEEITDFCQWLASQQIMQANVLKLGELMVDYCKEKKILFTGLMGSIHTNFMDIIDSMADLQLINYVDNSRYIELLITPP